MKKLPESDFEQVKAEFLQRVRLAVEDHSIPPELVVSVNKTGVKMVPVSEWTLEHQGVKEVSIVGLEDKREITVFLASSLSGTMLPPQVLYEQTTDRCHPSVKFPEGWDVWHTPTHWTIESSMTRFVDQILVPWTRE